MTWLAFVLLALAAFRTWKLLADDLILEPIRARLLDEREGLAEFVACPYCLGFWISLGWATAWWIWPHGSLIVALPFALSAVVAAVASVLDR